MLPQSVTEICDSAFMQTFFSGDLILPADIKKIGVSAFHGCTGFQGNLLLPENIDSIYGSAFVNCRFTGDLTIPSNIEYIGVNAFNNCKPPIKYPF